MAIDDNTSYELTGYQVKDLAGRIRRKAEASAIPTVNDATLTLVQNGTTVGTFTANQSTNTTVNLAGGVYADDPTSPATPAPWITSSEVNPTSFAVLVYVGEIAFVRQTYNNSALSLTDKIDFYAASGISATITSSTNLAMTLPTDGSYIASVKASLWTNGNSWDYMLFAIRKNGNVFARAMGPKISGAWGFVNAEGYTIIANGDALSVYLNTNGNNFSGGNMSRQDSKLIVEIYKVG